MSISSVSATAYTALAQQIQSQGTQVAQAGNTEQAVGTGQIGTQGQAVSSTQASASQEGGRAHHHHHGGGSGSATQGPPPPAGQASPPTNGAVNTLA